MEIDKEIEIGLDFVASFDVDATDHIEGVNYVLILRGPSSVEISGTYENGTVTFNAVASETASWSEGKFLWQFRQIQQNGSVKKLSEGSFTAKPNFSAIEAGADTRTKPEIVLGHINAILEERATWENRRFKIGTRELERHSLAELYALKKQLEAQIEREAAGRKSVRPFGRRVHVGFR